jgi:hypothetical protein
MIAHKRKVHSADIWHDSPRHQAGEHTRDQLWHAKILDFGLAKQQAGQRARAAETLQDIINKVIDKNSLRYQHRGELRTDLRRLKHGTVQS